MGSVPHGEGSVPAFVEFWPKPAHSSGTVALAGGTTFSPSVERGSVLSIDTKVLSLSWRHGSEITCGERSSDFVREAGAVRVTSMDRWRAAHALDFFAALVG